MCTVQRLLSKCQLDVLLLGRWEAVLALLHRGELHHGDLLSGGRDGESDLALLGRRGGRPRGGSIEATGDILEGPAFGLGHPEVGEDDEEDEEDHEDDEDIGAAQVLNTTQQNTTLRTGKGSD